MKKFVVVVAILVSLSAIASAADLSRYVEMREIQKIDVTQPAIVQLSNLDSTRVYVVATDKGETVPQQFQTTRKTTVILPTRVEGCISKCVDAQTLADSDMNTTFDFPLETSGTQKGVIKIMYAKPLATDKIVFQTTSDSYMPSSFRLMIDGKRILNTIQGSVVTFPMMNAQNVEIEFEYTQPIRFREVGVGTVTEEKVNNMIRFVYQPGTQYLLYGGVSIGREHVPTPPINLFAKTNEAELVLQASQKNILFKEQESQMNKDTDTDGLVNIIDNCPMQPNQDQKDGNGNGIGDVCDDYDYDGVATYVDNCPFVSNDTQVDTDRDTIGDACDQEESRFTEKHGWVPWVAFGVVFIAIIGMGYEVVRKLKK